MKATGIVRRIDALGRVGDPSLTTLAPWEVFSRAVLELAKRGGWGT